MRAAIQALLIILRCSPERLSALCSTHVCIRNRLDPLYSVRGLQRLSKLWFLPPLPALQQKLLWVMQP